MNIARLQVILNHDDPSIVSMGLCEFRDQCLLDHNMIEAFGYYGRGKDTIKQPIVPTIRGVLKSYISCSPDLEELFRIWNLPNRDSFPDLIASHTSCLAAILVCFKTLPEVTNKTVSRIIRQFGKSIESQLNSKDVSVLHSTLGLLLTMCSLNSSLSKDTYQKIIQTSDYFEDHLRNKEKNTQKVNNKDHDQVHNTSSCHLALLVVLRLLENTDPMIIHDILAPRSLWRLILNFLPKYDPEAHLIVLEWANEFCCNQDIDNHLILDVFDNKFISIISEFQIIQEKSEEINEGSNSEENSEKNQQIIHRSELVPEFLNKYSNLLSQITKDLFHSNKKKLKSHRTLVHSVRSKTISLMKSLQDRRHIADNYEILLRILRSQPDLLGECIANLSANWEVPSHPHSGLTQISSGEQTLSALVHLLDLVANVPVEDQPGSHIPFLVAVTKPGDISGTGDGLSDEALKILTESWVGELLPPGLTKREFTRLLSSDTIEIQENAFLLLEALLNRLQQKISCSTSSAFSAAKDRRRFDKFLLLAVSALLPDCQWLMNLRAKFMKDFQQSSSDETSVLEPSTPSTNPTDTEKYHQVTEESLSVKKVVDVDMDIESDFQLNVEGLDLNIASSSLSSKNGRALRAADIVDTKPAPSSESSARMETEDIEDLQFNIESLSPRGGDAIDELLKSLKPMPGSDGIEKAKREEHLDQRPAKQNRAVYLLKLVVRVLVGYSRILPESLTESGLDPLRLFDDIVPWDSNVSAKDALKRLGVDDSADICKEKSLVKNGDFDEGLVLLTLEFLEILCKSAEFKLVNRWMGQKDVLIKTLSNIFTSPDWRLGKRTPFCKLLLLAICDHKPLRDNAKKQLYLIMEASGLFVAHELVPIEMITEKSVWIESLSNWGDGDVAIICTALSLKLAFHYNYEICENISNFFSANRFISPSCSRVFQGDIVGVPFSPVLISLIYFCSCNFSIYFDDLPKNIRSNLTSSSTLSIDTIHSNQTNVVIDLSNDSATITPGSSTVLNRFTTGLRLEMASFAESLIILVLRSVNDHGLYLDLVSHLSADIERSTVIGLQQDRLSLRLELLGKVARGESAVDRISGDSFGENKDMIIDWIAHLRDIFSHSNRERKKREAHLKGKVPASLIASNHISISIRGLLHLVENFEVMIKVKATKEFQVFAEVVDDCWELVVHLLLTTQPNKILSKMEKAFDWMLEKLNVKKDRIKCSSIQPESTKYLPFLTLILKLMDSLAVAVPLTTSSSSADLTHFMKSITALFTDIVSSNQMDPHLLSKLLHNDFVLTHFLEEGIIGKCLRLLLLSTAKHILNKFRNSLLSHSLGDQLWIQFADRMSVIVPSQSISPISHADDLSELIWLVYSIVSQKMSGSAQTPSIISLRDYLIRSMFSHGNERGLSGLWEKASITGFSSVIKLDSLWSTFFKSMGHETFLHYAEKQQQQQQEQQQQQHEIQGDNFSNSLPWQNMMFNIKKISADGCAIVNEFYEINYLYHPLASVSTTGGEAQNTLTKILSSSAIARNIMSMHRQPSHSIETPSSWGYYNFRVYTLQNYFLHIGLKVSYPLFFENHFIQNSLSQQSNVVRNRLDSIGTSLAGGDSVTIVFSKCLEYLKSLSKMESEYFMELFYDTIAVEIESEKPIDFARLKQICVRFIHLISASINDLSSQSFDIETFMKWHMWAINFILDEIDLSLSNHESSESNDTYPASSIRYELTTSLILFLEIHMTKSIHLESSRLKMDESFDALYLKFGKLFECIKEESLVGHLFQIVSILTSTNSGYNYVTERIGREFVSKGSSMNCLGVFKTCVQLVDEDVLPASLEGGSYLNLLRLLNRLLELVCTHSLQQSMPLGRSDQMNVSKQRNRASQPALSVQESEDWCSVLISFLCRTYRGTMSSQDQLTLRLLHQMNESRLHKIDIRELVITSRSKSSVDLAPPHSSEESLRPGWILNVVTIQNVYRTLSNFPSSRKMLQSSPLDPLEIGVGISSPARYGSTSSLDDIYDPAYWIPAILNDVYQREVSIRQLASSGVLALVIASLCSDCNVLRSHALACLQQIHTYVKKQTPEVDISFKERPQVIMLLDFIRNAIEPSEGSDVTYFRLPHNVAIFLARTSIHILQSNHELFGKSNKYLLSRPFCDTKDIPLFDLMMTGPTGLSSVADSSETLSILRLLRDGLNAREDHLSFCRKNAYSTLMLQYPLMMEDVRVSHAIIDIFDKALCLRTSARYLLEKCSLFPWLQQLLTSTASTSSHTHRRENMPSVSSASRERKDDTGHTSHFPRLSTRYICLLRRSIGAACLLGADGVDTMKYISYAHLIIRYMVQSVSEVLSSKDKYDFVPIELTNQIVLSLWDCQLCSKALGSPFTWDLNQITDFCAAILQCDAYSQKDKQHITTSLLCFPAIYKHPKTSNRCVGLKSKALLRHSTSTFIRCIIPEDVLCSTTPEDTLMICRRSNAGDGSTDNNGEQASGRRETTSHSNLYISAMHILGGDMRSHGDEEHQRFVDPESDLVRHWTDFQTMNLEKILLPAVDTNDIIALSLLTQSLLSNISKDLQYSSEYNKKMEFSVGDVRFILLAFEKHFKNHENNLFRSTDRFHHYSQSWAWKAKIRILSIADEGPLTEYSELFCQFQLLYRLLITANTLILHSKIRSIFTEDSLDVFRKLWSVLLLQEFPSVGDALIPGYLVRHPEALNAFHLWKLTDHRGMIFELFEMNMEFISFVVSYVDSNGGIQDLLSVSHRPEEFQNRLFSFNKILDNIAELTRPFQTSQNDSLAASATDLIGGGERREASGREQWVADGPMELQEDNLMTSHNRPWFIPKDNNNLQKYSSTKSSAISGLIGSQPKAVSKKSGETAAKPSLKKRVWSRASQSINLSLSKGVKRLRTRK